VTVDEGATTMSQQIQLTEVAENVYEIPRTGEMHVPVRVYGSEALIEEMRSVDDLTLSQGRNVATLPGLRKFAVVLPDGHQGYGFPIGGVAAVDTETGAISPGGIGFDINCGVRLLRTPLSAADVEGHEQELADRLYETIPCGLGKGGYLDTDADDLRGILDRGMAWMLEAGHATEADLDHCEENGQLDGDPDAVPAEALSRGGNQVGSLGSGNHFLEVQRVAEVYDPETAAAFGLSADQVVVMIHSGSRGLGHQTCTEYVRRFERAFLDIADSLPDRQLIYAPLGEPVAEKYKRTMYAAANDAWANRQAMTQAVRAVFADLFDTGGIELVYDVCHNVAKEERHRVDGGEETVLVHRKGATRAFPVGRPEIPEAYRDVGQPVFIPGSMGTSSYVLCGGDRSLDLTFGSTAHGAGRVMSRMQAKKQYTASELQRSLREQGIYVRARSGGTLSEEAPGAYKDVDEVIRVSDALDIGTKVARTRPIANVKG
jgi:tRNA-splicing ligase RtcB